MIALALELGRVLLPGQARVVAVFDRLDVVGPARVLHEGVRHISPSEVHDGAHFEIIGAGSICIVQGWVFA